MDKEFIEYPEETSKPAKNEIENKSEAPQENKQSPNKIEQTKPDSPQETKKKGSNIGWILLFFVFLIGAGYLGYYYGYKVDKDKNKTHENAQVTDSEANFLIEDKKDETAAEDSCYEVMTSDEKALSENWITYTNSKYKYTFKYPKNWEIKHEEDDFISFLDNEDELSFQFRSDTMSALGFENYKLDKEEEMKINCAEANVAYLSGDTSLDPEMDTNSRLILTTFRINDIPHLVDISYKYKGASISSDIVEAYIAILKSIRFN